MIRYVRLVSGVELIGEEITNGDTNYQTSIVLRNPLALEILQRDGHAICSLVTYCVATADLELNWEFVLQTGEAAPAFAETYLRRCELGTDAPFYEERNESEFEDSETITDQEILDGIKATVH